MKHQLPTQKRLKELFSYNPATGVLTRKKTIANQAAGTVAGQKESHGYIKLMVDGKSLYAHRLIWMMVHGEEPVESVDHVNGNRADNRIANLREANLSENNRNCTNASKPSPYGKGVYKTNGKYTTLVAHKRKRHYGGYFRTATQAFLVACEMRNKLHGKFAHHC